jgi:DNA-binding transcriptional ArsR family regulator
MAPNPTQDSPDTLDTSCGTEEPLSEALPSSAVTDATVRLLKGFANETRLQILCLLRGREVCVHDIVEALGMSQSAVSHQLRVLRDARLVSHRREGRHVYYRLADDHVREMLENALTHGAEPESR